MSFNAIQISFWQIYYTFAEKPEKKFWTTLKKKRLHLWGNDWNTWRVEGFCVHSVKRL